MTSTISFLYRCQTRLMSHCISGLTYLCAPSASQEAELARQIKEAETCLQAQRHGQKEFPTTVLEQSVKVKD